MGTLNNGWLWAFVITFIFLFVILVIAIIDLNSYAQTRYRISRAIENNNECAGYNSGICELHVDFNLAVPSLSPDYSTDVALFCGNLVASVEYAFLQNSSNPNVMLPFSVSKVVDIVYNNNIIGTMCVGGGVIWVAFRGTRTSQEWDKDLMFQQVSYPHSTLYPVTQRYYTLTTPSNEQKAKDNPSKQRPSPYFQGLLHEGFLDVYDSIREQLQSNIANLSEASIMFCGHSLGGALATIGCADVFGSKTNQGYVFGCPRVGNQTFCTSLSSIPFFRLWNQDDIVCDLPPSVSPNFIGGNPDDVFLYAHAGKATSFNDNRGALLYNHAMECYLTFLRG